MKQILGVLLLVLSLGACVKLPIDKQAQDEIIAVGPGPEDMVIDELSWKEPRLLISCNARRKGEDYYAEILSYNLMTGQRKALHRVEPSEVHFNPHGIDLVQVKDSLILLVVNHYHEQKENSILRYLVVKDTLYFLQKIVDPLIVSPNAVTGFSDGTMLVSNDAKKPGNFWHVLFIIKKAQIVYWDGNHCSVASEGYCYTNGITNKNGKVYLASTRQNKVWQFDFRDGKMLNKTEVAKVHGPDNIRFYGDNLLVACHLRFVAFLKHYKHAEKISPTTVYRINPVSKESEVVYYDNGKQLSAGSTAVIYKGNIYVSGVFDPKLAKRQLK
ncbi:MAG: hypothetical protein U0V74_14000 [Chitinophagales bacterium]